MASASSLITRVGGPPALTMISTRRGRSRAARTPRRSPTDEVAVRTVFGKQGVGLRDRPTAVPPCSRRAKFRAILEPMTARPVTPICAVDREEPVDRLRCASGGLSQNQMTTAAGARSARGGRPRSWGAPARRWRRRVGERWSSGLLGGGQPAYPNHRVSVRPPPACRPEWACGAGATRARASGWGPLRRPRRRRRAVRPAVVPALSALALRTKRGMQCAAMNASRTRSYRARQMSPLMAQDHATSSASPRVSSVRGSGPPAAAGRAGRPAVSATSSTRNRLRSRRASPSRSTIIKRCRARRPGGDRHLDDGHGQSCADEQGQPEHQRRLLATPASPGRDSDGCRRSAAVGPRTKSRDACQPGAEGGQHWPAQCLPQHHRRARGACIGHFARASRPAPAPRGQGESVKASADTPDSQPQTDGCPLGSRIR